MGIHGWWKRGNHDDDGGWGHKFWSGLKHRDDDHNRSWKQRDDDDDHGSHGWWKRHSKDDDHRHGWHKKHRDDDDDPGDHGGPRDDHSDGFEWGHCGKGHENGHGDHDHWNNGHWRHACNTAPVITAPTNTSPTIGDPDIGGAVTLVVATDADGDTLVYSISGEDVPGSADAEFFAIDPVTGLVTLAQGISPTGSADGDSTYELQVQVTDGEDVDTIDLAITFAFGG